MESGEAVREAVKRARMEERPGAEEALHDIELNGWRGRFAEGSSCGSRTSWPTSWLHAARNDPPRDAPRAGSAARRPPDGL